MAQGEKRYNLAFLQYRNSAQANISSTTFVNMPLDLNTNSLPDARFTKINDTDFRCDFNGFAEAFFKTYFLPSNADANIEVQVTKNGTALPGSLATAWADDGDEPNTATCSIKFPVTNGDIVRFQIRTVRAGTMAISTEQFLGRVELSAEV